MAKEKIDRQKKQKDELKKYGILGKEKVEKLKRERKKRMEEAAKPKINKRPRPKGEPKRVKRELSSPSPIPKKDSSFKLRSGNNPSVAKMTGVSPMKVVPAIPVAIAGGKALLGLGARYLARRGAGQLLKRGAGQIFKQGVKKRGLATGSFVTKGQKRLKNILGFGAASVATSEVSKRLNKSNEAKAKTTTTTQPKKQTKTVKPNPKTGTLTYKQAYNKMSDKQKSKYKNYDDFAKQAKAYNMKKYGTINPTAEARKQGISKQELSKRRKKKLKTGVSLKATKNSRGQTVYVKA
tara:strand:+ start:80 stop:961 length:882 start_codon:yes stop_codon:yes gene_type:complete